MTRFSSWLGMTSGMQRVGRGRRKTHLSLVGEAGAHGAERNAIRVRGHGLSRDLDRWTDLNPSPGFPACRAKSGLSRKGRGGSLRCRPRATDTLAVMKPAGADDE
jgi:hypothetical protein